MNLSFALLCDSERTMIKQYDLLNPFEHDGIAYPAIFILNPEREIRYRSLDGTAQRIDFSEIYAFLDAFVTTADYSLETSGKKKIIVPSPRSLFMITRNMLFRGNFSDWKHYILFPVTITRLTFRMLFKKK